ncbi:hypothetical protein Y032_0064g3556 [Ancylostoma ceylanicum]|uniref:Uncharacterized protein n=1 Tax=Ancylostoma ceylanicum TaxID=53326 RepID=A0A016U0I2_9BILA|nr:hypothetical protein Y032_0064g3556 [Ancylostoma ceylanicum]
MTPDTKYPSLIKSLHMRVHSSGMICHTLDVSAIDAVLASNVAASFGVHHHKTLLQALLLLQHGEHTCGF